MTIHLAGRDRMVESVRRELMGPAPAGEPVDLDRSVAFATKQESYGPNVDARTGEELLGWTRPVKRYGVGVLFPHEARRRDQSALAAAVEDEEADRPVLEGDLSAEAAADLQRLERRSGGEAEDGPGLDLTGANARRPSSMGVTVLVGDDIATLAVRASGGRYHRVEVHMEDAEEPRSIFRRSAWEVDARLPMGDRPEAGSTRRLVPMASQGLDGLDVALETTIRPHTGGGSLVTVVIINRTTGADYDGSCLFQTELQVSTHDGMDAPSAGIRPYPGPPLEALDDEERSLALLYRDFAIFGIGHNCGADWTADPGTAAVAQVRGTPLPVVETPSITPQLERADGSDLTVPMAPLAGLASDSGESGLRELIDAYGSWIEDRRTEAAGLSGPLAETARSHVAACERARDRMVEGLELLGRDRTVRRAFELANRAILLQQLRSELRPRTVTKIPTNGDAVFEEPARVVDVLQAGTRGSWRPFQMAFILAALASTADGEHTGREDVELIFFPTGGGKTEAYLGLAAFSILLRRLRDPADAGVDVLMRYTLRLLTAQQFLRATRLVCALEKLRRDFERELGRIPISIGIWLGSATTPNSRQQALAALKRLKTDPANAEDPFLLNRCPWCAAEMGAVRVGKARPSAVVGYEQHAGTVRLQCPDSRCDFAQGLPVYVIDEDLYEHRPAIVIGTVDKLAMLAWRDDARSLFGLDPHGERRWSPPNLVIQDELHLISGPLGSMVGLYELTIEELCTDRRRGAPIRPKIVTSTATIRGFDHQVRALFGREKVNLFPPHGLGADDSFFARYARTDDGELAPGRLHVGVHASNHTSLIETQVAVMAALLQGAQDLEPDLRDPWWTQLVFFNSLRELGTSLSLAQSNVPMQVRSIAQREGIDRAGQRYIRHLTELTSRLRNDEVPRAINDLERRVDDERPVDICLASNIIEVGIDIDRLSLMVVVGQPKTTSQYIQVTGRVGRRWWERPGLVMTLLNPGRPRDRSHFERFRSYHERLYAQVEPTSVTPFSPPAVDRALHGALVAFLRQRVDLRTVDGPDDVPAALLEEFRGLLRARVTAIDPREGERVMAKLSERLEEMRVYGRDRWARAFSGEEGLLVPLGEDLSRIPEQFVWETPMSMRSVDAECEMRITKAYAVDHLQQEREVTRG